jgi:hypothetical protein
MSLQSSLIASMALLAPAGEAHAEWIAFVYTGTSHTFGSQVRIRQPDSRTDATFESVSWAPHPFTQGAPYYGIRVSYYPGASAHVGAALDFTHYKMYAETAAVVRLQGVWNGSAVNELTYLGSRIQHLEISHGVNLTSINAQYRWKPAIGSAGRWQTHVGAGVLVYLPHAEGRVNDVGVSGDYQYAGQGGQIFGGAGYQLSRHLGVMLESKFDVGSLDVDLDPRTRISTDVRTVHVLAGFTVRF